MTTKQKPTKPYKDFPLYAHSAGQWAKKIRGRLHYFGPWHDWRAALDKYIDQREDLHAGRKPRAISGGPTIKDLVNQFLSDKESLVEVGELSRRSWNDYLRTAKRVASVFGKDRRLDDLRPSDFATLRASYPKTWGVTTVGNEITRVRVLFGYAGPEALALLDRPIAFGPLFKRPSAKAQRIARASKPKKLFEAEEIRKMIDHAEPNLRAMILLGINAGLGNRDCASLTLGRIDRLESDGARRLVNSARGWLNYPRPKTGVSRRARLWPETIAAIDEVTEDRDLGLASPIFLTKYGRPYRHDYASGSCPIAHQTRKLLDGLRLYQPGRSFYALRHTFQTIGERCGDLVAVSSIMGHIDASMAGNYRETLEDDRLERVAETVKDWLFGTSEKKSEKRSDQA